MTSTWWTIIGRAVLICLMALAAAAPAAAADIAPFKDDLFAHPAVVEESADGGFWRYDYREMRDINGRDEIPERRAKRAYVDLSVHRAARERAIATEAGQITVNEFGVETGARFVVIFVHGRDGDRRLGSDDWRFGGNFNRLKNLATRNGGTYYVPSLPDFEAGGQGVIRALFAHSRQVSPQAPIVLACGSMGSALCVAAARDGALAAGLGGLVLLGGMPDASLVDSAAARARLPIVFAHGENDRVYDWRNQRAVFDGLRSIGGYPTRFHLFATGSHGTPIRMIDWRETLNFVLRTAH